MNLVNNHPWIPPDLSSRTRRALEGLRARLDALDPEAVGSPELAGGAAGQALAWMAQGPERAGQAGIWLARAVELASDGELHYGLLTGLAGVLWTIELARNQDEEDPNQEMDVLLLDLVLGVGDDESLDVISGLCGVAVYAAERMPAPGAAELLGAVAEKVAARARVVPGGVVWEVDPGLTAARAAQGTSSLPWDLGLAHGTPGPLSALALAQAWGVADHGALLDGGLAFLLAQDQPPRSFPTAAGPGTCSRGRGTGWCYGGLGVGAWWVAVGELLGRSELVSLGTALLLRHATDHLDTKDPGLCHGDAGLALLLGRAAARDPRLREPAVAALGRLLGRLEGGALAEPTVYGHAPERDLLEGLPGVAITLSTLLGEGTVPLERLLLTELRGPATPERRGSL